MPDETILVVDDDPGIREAIADILTLEGYQVATAGDGREALQVVEQTRPALVLLDMRMPVLDGWGFARALRERGLRLPIVVMTAAQDARHWATEISADGYLPKPFNITDLLTTIEHFQQ